MLSGGSPRSLGRTEEVVKLVLADHGRFRECFQLLFSADEIVRMRAADGLEKVCRQQPCWFIPYSGRLLSEVSQIKQPSVQWHLAQMLGEIPLSPADRKRAVRLLKSRAQSGNDWIVINMALESLSTLAKTDAQLRSEVEAICAGYLNSPYKSIVTRCRRILKTLEREQGNNQTSTSKSVKILVRRLKGRR